MLTKTQVAKLQRDLNGADTKLSTLFNALGDPVRFKLFRLLVVNKDVCVSDIANILNVSVPAASYQLKALEVAGLVRRDRRGKTVCYCVRKDDPIVKSVMRMVK